MATKTPPRRALSDAQLAEMMDLLKGSDTVELKLTVPESPAARRDQVAGFDPLDAQIRQVIFFDTPDLVLNKAGVVVRARRIQGGATTRRQAAPGRSRRAAAELRSCRASASRSMRSRRVRLLGR